jgi:hypothetical protein
MELHWGKFRLLEASGSYRLLAPDGSNKYNCITGGHDVLRGTHLRRRAHQERAEFQLGAARAEFCKMSHLWKRTTSRRDCKIPIFNACVLTRLLYSLTFACLNVAGTERLDGFHCWRLRVICNVKFVLVRDCRQSFKNLASLSSATSCEIDS